MGKRDGWGWHPWQEESCKHDPGTHSFIPFGSGTKREGRAGGDEVSQAGKQGPVMPCRGIWTGFLAGGGLSRSGGGGMTTSLWLWLEEGLEDGETRGRGVTGVGLEAGTRAQVRGGKGPSQGRGSGASRGASWGGRLEVRFRRARGRQGSGCVAALSLARPPF